MSITDELSKVACWTLSLMLAAANASAAAPRPNVVIFLADDAGWGDYSFSGNRQVATPNVETHILFGTVNNTAGR